MNVNKSFHEAQKLEDSATGENAIFLYDLQGSSENLPANYVENYEELQAACRRSQVTKALLAMQKAHSINNLGKTTTEQKQYLEVRHLLRKIFQSVFNNISTIFKWNIQLHFTE